MKNTLKCVKVLFAPQSPRSAHKIMNKLHPARLRNWYLQTNTLANVIAEKFHRVNLAPSPVTCGKTEFAKLLVAEHILVE